MYVTSTEIQNNFGKYLMMAAREDIIITKNGREVARLSAENNNITHKKTLINAAKEEQVEYRITGDYGGQKATYEEFLEFAKNNEKSRYEYIDGEIFLLASPRTVHQFAVKKLLFTFEQWFEKGECTPIMAPYDITLKSNNDDINIVQPDLMIICDLEEKLSEDGYYKGIPILIAEVVSESSRRMDMVKKLNLYMDSGIQEYWIVDPVKKIITIYHMKKGNIINYASFSKDKTVKSFIFEGLTVNSDTVFRF